MAYRKFRCCLCGRLIEDEDGNNPDPLGSHLNKCCDKCNNELVAPARIAQLTNDK